MWQQYARIPRDNEHLIINAEIIKCSVMTYSSCISTAVALEFKRNCWKSFRTFCPAAEQNLFIKPT